MIKRFLIALVAAGCLGVSSAKTYYVNCQMDDYTKHDGLTPEKALMTIQEGIDKCSKAGDTVLVAPGDYNHGSRKISGGLPAWGKNVIMLESKQVTVRATEGNGVTFISGQHGSHLNTNGDPDGCGVDTNDFVRCIAAYGNEVAGTVIEGFTIRNGACLYSASAPGAAYNSYGSGGIFCRESGRICVVDCVLSNNVGGSDAVYVNANFIRSKIVGHVLKGPSTSPSLASDCYFINCYVAHNNVWMNGIVAAGGSTRIINSTFVDNNFSQQAYNQNTVIANSIINGRVNSPVAPTTYTSLVYGDNYDSKPYAILAPPLDDYRVRFGSGAESMGDPDYLKDVELPDSVERYFDIDGEEISPSGAIAIGCCQTVVEPAAGGIFFNFYNQAMRFPYWRVDGGPIMHRDSYVFPGPGEIHSYHFEFFSTNSATCRPVYIFVTERDDPGSKTYNTPCGRATHAYPDGDGSLYLLPNLDKSRWICLNQIYSSTSVLYLDAKASSAGADGSEAHPFRTFKDAIEYELSGTHPVLLVKPGVYAEGEMLSPYEKSLNAKARIIPGSKMVFAASLEGPEKTVIMGAADSATATGCGDNAVRISICGGAIGSKTGQGGVLLHGFTLTGGYSATSKTDEVANPTYWPYSGVMLSEYTHSLARNCIISNNVGQYAAAGHWSIYDRCRILDNRTVADQTLLNGCYLTSCLIANNRCYRLFNPDSWAKTINCTCVGQSRSNVHYENGSGCDRYNNIHLTGTTPGTAGDLGGNVFWNFANVPQVLEARVMDPFVLRPETGDARIFQGSPAVSSGVAPTSNNDWFLLSRDLSGRPWRYLDGVGASGAVQDVVTNGLYLAATAGGVAIDGKSGYFELEDGEEVTVEYAEGSSRPVGSVSENGVDRELPLTISASDLAAAGGMLLVNANYTNVWYVDAVHGSDANFGYSTNNAFRTLQFAMDNPNLIAYDRVLAMPGNYAEGGMVMPSTAKKPDWANYAYVDYTIASRVIVPKNVTLESIYGRKVTTISGKWATTPGEWIYSESDVIRGMGNDAMHAVTLNSGARVKGFTITLGFSRLPVNHGKDAYAPSHADPDFCGGGVTAYYTASGNARNNCWAEDCFFTNNASYRGGGVMAVNCLNCEFVDNVACYGGGASSDSRIYGCLSRDNFANIPYYKTSQQHNGFFYGGLIHNSTLFDGCCLDADSRKVEGSMRNNLIFGKFLYSEFEPQTLKYCVINNDTSGSVPQIFASVSNANHCTYTIGENLQFDAEFRPVLGHNVAIDAGESSLIAVDMATDESGLQRIYNHSLLDIGALEYDWRPVYTESLSNSKRITVTEASPSVYNSFENVVRLPVDAQVVTSWLGEAGRKQNYSCSARVSGNGTLVVTLNGEELGRIEGTGEQEFTFLNDYAANTVVFVYSGTDGYAELLSTGRGGGSLIMCR